MGVKINKSLRKFIKHAKTQILRTILSLLDEIEPVNVLIYILFFGAFAGLIFSVCLMGVNGDLFWGFFALLFAAVVLIVGIITGAF